MMQKWQVKETKIVFDASPYLRLRQDHCILPNGVIIPDYNVIEEDDIVIVFAVTQEQEVLLVEQYKHGIGEICLTLPGGFCESENYLKEMQRELQEETGYQSDDWQEIGSYIKDPSRNPNRIHLFLAKNCYQAGEQSLDPAEIITVRTIPLSDIEQAIKDRRITSMHSIAAIYSAMMNF